MKQNLKNTDIAKEINDKRYGLSIYIGICQVDCDQVEFTSRAIVPATLKDYIEFDERLHMEAEGGYSLSILTIEEYANWIQPSIDHRAEQYNY